MKIKLITSTGKAYDFSPQNPQKLGGETGKYYLPEVGLFEFDEENGVRAVKTDKNGEKYANITVIMNASEVVKTMLAQKKGYLVAYDGEKTVNGRKEIVEYLFTPSMPCPPEALCFDTKKEQVFFRSRKGLLDILKKMGYKPFRTIDPTEFYKAVALVQKAGESQTLKIRQKDGTAEVKTLKRVPKNTGEFLEVVHTAGCLPIEYRLVKWAEKDPHAPHDIVVQFNGHSLPVDLKSCISNPLEGTGKNKKAAGTTHGIRVEVFEKAAQQQVESKFKLVLAK